MPKYSATTKLKFLLAFNAGAGLLVSNAFVIHRPSPTTQVVRSVLDLSLSKKSSDASTAFNSLWNFDNLLSNGRKDDSLIENGGEDRGLLTTSGRSSLMLLSSTLAPAVEFLDEKTDGWALTYADLRPESEQTAIGQSFLATNIAYAAVGFLLSSQGEALLGFMTEIVSVASICYHYTQLQQPYNRTDDVTVKLALMVDYILAVSSICIGVFYIFVDQTLPSIEVIGSSMIGIGCLLACWVWEKGYPYIVLHSLWHIFSATTAYSIGLSHIKMSV